MDVKLRAELTWIFYAVVMARKALQRTVLSDGLVIPKGVTVAIPQYAVNYDDGHFADPELFKPFRFVKTQENTEKDFEATTPAADTFDSITGTGVDFGRGRAACPGRYFASWCMKVFLAHFLLRFEVKLEAGTARPDDIVAGPHRLANPSTHIMIRSVTFDK